MKKLSAILAALILLLAAPQAARAWDLSHLLSGGIKAVQAATISDSQVQGYVHQYITDLDRKSNIPSDSDPYAVRLKKLTTGLNSVEGIPLNFKVYIVKDVNAFACADGSVRVYSGLMDLMTDDEVLGVIGHEIGHVAHKDTKKAFKHALLTSAFFDGLGATSSGVAALTDSQLGALGQSLLKANYSKKQESDADDYGYQFLLSHGKNPWAMAMAFSKLKSLEGTTGTNGLYQLFSSHPDTDKRIARMIKKCRKDGIPRPAGCNL